jgi:hypothetical protein
MSKARDIEPTGAGTPPPAAMGGEVKCGDVTPQGVETGRLQAPVTMGSQTNSAPSGLTTGIRTSQTMPPGPSP